MPTVDSTVKGASANSYVTVAEATTYLDNHKRSAELALWTAASDDDKARAVIAATTHVDSYYEFVGYRTTTTQALKWPRAGVMTRDGDAYLDQDTIPQLLKDAVCEQAFVEVQSDRAADSSTCGIHRVKADVLEVEFDGIESQEQKVVADIVAAMLDAWIEGYTGSSAFETVDLARV